jgi:hypothetical protein
VTVPSHTSSNCGGCPYMLWRRTMDLLPARQRSRRAALITHARSLRVEWFNLHWVGVTSPPCPLPRHTCRPLKGVRQVRQWGGFRAALCPAPPLEGAAAL